MVGSGSGVCVVSGIGAVQAANRKRVKTSSQIFLSTLQFYSKAANLFWLLIQVLIFQFCGKKDTIP
jgi:hypothetical protein